MSPAQGSVHVPPLVINPQSGRERYVFFSFPHIAIDSQVNLTNGCDQLVFYRHTESVIGPQGSVGTIMRPGRDAKSCACGALRKCLGEFIEEGYEPNCGVPGAYVVGWWLPFS